MTPNRRRWRSSGRAAGGAALVITALVLSACSGNPSSGTGDSTSSGEPVTVRIADGGAGNIMDMPVRMAAALGYFEDEGIDAQFTAFGTGALATTAVVSGAMDFATNTSAGVQIANAQGANLVQTVLMSMTQGIVLVVNKENADVTLDGLDELTIGVSGLGTPPEFFVRNVFANNDLDASSLKLAATANGVAAINAITSNRVQAEAQFDPLVTNLVQEYGAKVLVDTRTLKGSDAAFGGPYGGGNLAVTQSYLADNKETVQAVSRAIVKTLTWLQTHSAEEIVAKLPPEIYYPTPEQKALLTAALPGNVELFSGDGKESEEMMANTQRNLQIAQPSVDYSTLDFSKIYFNDF